MIIYCNSTVFNVDHVDAIVNTVNTEGFMGAGLALEMSLRYPKMFLNYKAKCQKGLISVGKVDYYDNLDIIIINFPTKKQYKYPSQLKWIEDGLIDFCKSYKEHNIKSVAFPKMGTLNGKLNWKDVENLMLKHLSNLDINIYICLDSNGRALGKELEMVNSFNTCNIDQLSKFVRLTLKQKNILSNVKPITRFYELSKISGIGISTYCNLFNVFFYNKYFEERNLFSTY